MQVKRKLESRIVLRGGSGYVFYAVVVVDVVVDVVIPAVLVVAAAAAASSTVTPFAHLRTGQ